VKIIHIPNVYIPADLSLPSEEELQLMTRPLQLCTTCRYVLCSCGNCHNSQRCNETCLYEQTEGQPNG